MSQALAKRHNLKPTRTLQLPSMPLSINEWLAQQVPHLIQMAALPFELEAHEDFCERIGWEPFREDWYPENCFEVQFEEVERRLFAVYDETEFGVAIGLFALICEPSNHQCCLETQEEFDEAFRTTLACIEPMFETPTMRGTYRDPRIAGLFHDAYWSIGETFLTLVQHSEGDANVGSFSSLDLRLVPRRGASTLRFPLKTNILF